jgi:hypothetical protein
MKKHYCFHCKEKRHVTNKKPRCIGARGGPYLWCKHCLRRIKRPSKPTAKPIAGERRGLLYTVRRIVGGE